MFELPPVGCRLGLTRDRRISIARNGDHTNDSSRAASRMRSQRGQPPVPVGAPPPGFGGASPGPDGGAERSFMAGRAAGLILNTSGGAGRRRRPGGGPWEALAALIQGRPEVQQRHQRAPQSEFPLGLALTDFDDSATKREVHRFVLFYNGAESVGSGFHVPLMIACLSH